MRKGIQGQHPVNKKMAKVICLSSQKGGAGKTTSTHNIAVRLANLNNRVLLIDLDPSGNLTKCVGFERGAFDSDACDLFEKERQVKAYPTNVANLYIIPSSSELAVYRGKLILANAGERYLERSLKRIKSNFDYIIIDTPPAIDLLVMNAHVASDYLIIPTDPDLISESNLDDSVSFFNTVLEDELNPNLKYLGVIVTRIRIQNTDHTELVADYKTKYPVFGEVMLSKDATVGFKQGKCAIEVRPSGAVASEYRLITNKILTKIREVEENGNN